MIAQTSLLAYVEVLESIGTRQMQIYKTIEEIGPCSNTMISKRLHLPINCITGRSNELRKQGLVYSPHKAQCPITKKKVMFLKVKHKLR